MVTAILPHKTDKLNTLPEGPTTRKTVLSPDQARARAFVLRLSRECRVKPYPDGYVPPCTVMLNTHLYEQGWFWFGWDRDIVDDAINDAALFNLIALKPLASVIQVEIPEGYDAEYDECKPS